MPTRSCCIDLVIILLDNAVKFTRPGGTIRVELGRSHRQAVLSVRDEGPGVPAADRDRIFDRFYRGSAHPAGSAGAGLGLAIAQWIAHQHGGTVELAESGPGGSVFTVSVSTGIEEDDSQTIQN